MTESRNLRLVASAVVATLLILGTVYHFYSLDGLFGSIAAAAMDKGTVYAPGYTDRAFRRVAPGMSEADVRELLGEPLHVDETRWGTVIWSYSKSPSDASYRYRNVVLESGRVVRIRHGLYLD